MTFHVRKVRGASLTRSEPDAAGNKSPSRVTVCVTGGTKMRKELELDLSTYQAMALVAHLQKALCGSVVPWPDKQRLKGTLAFVKAMREEDTKDKQRKKRSGKKHKRAT